MDRNFSRRAFNGALAATALGSLSLFAGAAGAQTVEELKKKGKLTVGMLVDFPPYGITNTQNLPDGYDADVAKLLAKDLGVPVDIVPVTGPNRIPFLLTNKVDMLIASLAITPERAKQVQFSQPYAAATDCAEASGANAVRAAPRPKAAKAAVAVRRCKEKVIACLLVVGVNENRKKKEGCGAWVSAPEHGRACAPCVRPAATAASRSRSTARPRW